MMGPLGVRRLSALDNAFLAVETPTAPMHFSCLAVYEIDAALGDRPTHLVTEIMRHAVHDVPALRRTLLPSVPRMNRAYWGPVRDIDVTDHIRTVRLGGARDRDELLSTAAALHAERLPRQRPLWDITVIRGVQQGEVRPSRERFAVLFRVHHAAVDGVTGMALFATLHDREPIEVEALGTRSVRSTPSLKQRLRNTMSDNLDAAAGPLRATLRLGRDLTARRAGAPGDRTPFALPWTVLNQRVARDRVVVSVAVPRNAVSAVRRAVAEATVNDVMLTTVGGALRMLLGDALAGDLVAGVPVARFGHAESMEPGNDFDLLRIPLGVDEPDPIARLIAVHGAAERSKAAHRRGAVELNDAAALVPGWLLDAVVRASPRAARLGVPMPAVSTIVSNVPGPRFSLYLGPAELTDLQALGPIAHGLSVFHVITSYRDSVTITVTSSSSVLTNPSAYADILRASFGQLVYAAEMSTGTIAT